MNRLCPRRAKPALAAAVIAPHLHRSEIPMFDWIFFEVVLTPSVLLAADWARMRRHTALR